MHALNTLSQNRLTEQAKIDQITFWYTFFIVCPAIVIAQNLSFFIFPFWLYAIYQVSGRWIKFTTVFHWLAIAFAIGALMSVLYMPEEMVARNGMQRALAVLLNYMYWVFLICFMVTNRDLLNVVVILKAIFFALICITFYYFIQDVLLFVPVFDRVSQNTYAFIALAYAPPAVYYAQRRWGNVFAVVFLLVLIVLNFLGGSRSGSVLVTVGGAMVFLLTNRNSIIWVILYCFIAYQAALLVLEIPAVQQTIYALNIRTYDLIYKSEETFSTDRSYLVRQAMIEKGLALHKKYPYTGIGLNNFTNYELRVKGTFDGAKFVNRKDIFLDKSAHNSYIGLLAEGGYLLVIPFILLMGGMLVYFIIAYRKIQPIYRPFYFGLLCMSIHLYFIMAIVNVYAWFLIALTAAFLYKKNQ